ncbi:hypothetical protein LCGC14_1152360 [marine sediment metagenome]|uniref:Uncharacterized protein n=1 Tax=marine sediment metagenome TaxID=412755 RepID=A0A0F9MIA8_9ZZZZ
MWLWKCIVCEKDLTPDMDYPGDDERACLPNLEGGTINIDFGYGSRFDDVNLDKRIQHQASICDDCYEKKIKLTRPVSVSHVMRWHILDSDYRDRVRRRNQERQQKRA